MAYFHDNITQNKVYNQIIVPPSLSKLSGSIHNQYIIHNDLLLQVERGGGGGSGGTP